MNELWDFNLIPKIFYYKWQLKFEEHTFSFPSYQVSEYFLIPISMQINNLFDNESDENLLFGYG